MFRRFRKGGGDGFEAIVAPLERDKRQQSMHVAANDSELLDATIIRTVMRAHGGQGQEAAERRYARTYEEVMDRHGISQWDMPTVAVQCYDNIWQGMEDRRGESRSDGGMS